MTRWIGLERVKQRFRSMAQNTRREILAAQIQSAEELVAMMKRLAPVDDGDLRDAIHYEVRPGTIEGTSTIVIIAGNEKVGYGYIVEFGSQPHRVGGRFAGAMHPGTQAQPFFYPTYRARRRSIRNRNRRAFRKIVKAGA